MIEIFVTVIGEEKKMLLRDRNVLILASRTLCRISNKLKKFSITRNWKRIMVNDSTAFEGSPQVCFRCQRRLRVLSQWPPFWCKNIVRSAFNLYDATGGLKHTHSHIYSKTINLLRARSEFRTITFLAEACGLSEFRIVATVVGFFMMFRI